MIPPGYTLVRPISEGAFGRVLEIKESSTGQSYALKLIPRLTEADQKRAEREVSLLERFRHARIVGLHESVVMETYHGIVMDLGVRNLKDLMTDFESRNELIPLEVAVMICIDIAEGLSVMHNHPTNAMAHGDLKPENVLLSEDYRDLGAADASGVNVTRSASSMATFEYNSPERFDDDKTKGTPASDIWSLGVMLCRMVTGQALFSGNSTWKLMKAVMDFDESKLPSTIPDDVRGVLVKMLEPNPASRVTSTQLFDGRQLERILGPETPLSKMKDLLIQSASRKPKQKSQNEQNPNLEVMKEEQARHHALLERNKNLKRDLELATPETTRECVSVNTIANSKKDSAEDTARQAENERNEELRNQDVLSAMLPSVWPRTESITSFDSKVHKLTADCVVQTVKLGQDWRTVFTFGLIAGEWELSIRGNENPLSSVLLGFLRFPLPSDSLVNHCGKYEEPIGGDFDLSNGRMWSQGKELKPAGTNKACTEVGQTASIRVDLSKREARLVVDGIAQPGVFENIPCQVCLGMSTGYGKRKSAVEIIHLRRLNASLIRPKFTIPRNTPNCFFGTSSFLSFNPEFHTITTTSIVHSSDLMPPFTSFTRPITQGVWELKFRASHTTFTAVTLGYSQHPLPDRPAPYTGGCYRTGTCGDFMLKDGRMWKSGKEFKPAGTNKKCDRFGQTAAIRVDMNKRIAKLCVDDKEQPGFFTDIPQSLCLGISTEFADQNLSVEVLWLKRLDVADVPVSALPPQTASHTPLTTQTPAQPAQSRSNVAQSTSQTPQQSPPQRTVAASPQTQSLSQSTGSVSSPNTASADHQTILGTSALELYDRSGATLSPSVLTIKGPDSGQSQNCLTKSFFTEEITEGEWELKIKGTEDLFDHILLGYLSSPLNKDAFNFTCGAWKTGIGGGFVVDAGQMWKSGKEYKPVGTNKACVRVGQTAAIRVNMEKREAKLFVDDEEQPGVFPDVPIQIRLALSHSDITSEFKIEVIHLKRLDAGIARQPPRKLENTANLWPGTNSLVQFNEEEIRLTPKQVVQTQCPKGLLRLAHTFEIDEGEWELKIRVNHSSLERTWLGYSYTPLPGQAAQNTNSRPSDFLCFFFLPEGFQRMSRTTTLDWRNKKCLNIGQTAAIRVNMEKRTATLYVDDEEQPHPIFPLPDVVRLMIGTGFTAAQKSFEVMYLKKLRFTPKHTLPPNTPTCLYGTSSLQTLPPPFTPFTSSILLSTVPGTGEQSSTETISLQGLSTAYTQAITEGEWELKIRHVGPTPGASALGFHHHPLPFTPSPSTSPPTETGTHFDFNLVNGMLMTDRQSTPNSPKGNGKCGKTGQTAAIRVNMTLRTATLFVDDEKQPNIFSDLPDCVYLGITHPHRMVKEDQHYIEVIWLKRVDDAAIAASVLPPQTAPHTRQTTRMSKEEKKRRREEIRILKRAVELQREQEQDESEDETNPSPPPASIPPPTGLTIIPKSTADTTLFEGTSVLKRFDRTCATTTQSFFTDPITEGEWELKIKGTEDLFDNISLGYLSDPFVNDAFDMTCSTYSDGSGGEYELKTGQMWKGGEFKPAGTNKACVRVGQTAAIRVNMEKREARLFVDDEEQPGVFPDVPIQIRLALSHSDITSEFKIEVIHLKRLDAGIARQPPRKLENTPDMWPGTNSLVQFNDSIKLTPTQLIQTTSSQRDTPVAHTFAIDEGEWELKIRVNHSSLEGTFLGYTSTPLADQTTQGNDTHSTPLYHGFILPSGHQRVFSSSQTYKANKPCLSVGQTAAIRVNMEEREARLFVDDEEQPRPNFPLPDVVYLAILPGFTVAQKSLEVMWLKKLRSTPKHTLPPNTPTCLYGISCLKTFLSTVTVAFRYFHVQDIPTETVELRPAYTQAITEGEWELKIQRHGPTKRTTLGFHHHPLPSTSSTSITQPTQKGDQFDFDLFTGHRYKNRQTIQDSSQGYLSVLSAFPKNNGTWRDTGQTAAIRVNMTLRTATLFVDDEKQPNIFSDLPDRVYLGVTRPFETSNESNPHVEVLWLKRLDDPTSPIPRPLMDGITCLNTINPECDVLLPAKFLSRGSKTAKGSWRTVFTGPITEGQWELEIEKESYTINATILGFVSHPLPPNATQQSCADWPSKQGGGFHLEEGSVWEGGQAIRPQHSNNTFSDFGCHAKIVVDMQNRKACLFVGDKIQPAEFENIPQALCLAISHRVEERDFTTKIIHLKRLPDPSQAPPTQTAARQSEPAPKYSSTLSSYSMILTSAPRTNSYLDEPSQPPTPSPTQTAVPQPGLPPIVLEPPLSIPATPSAPPPQFFLTELPPHQQESIEGPSCLKTLPKSFTVAKAILTAAPKEVKSNGVVRKTAYTGPITEGEWELKIKSTEKTVLRNLGLGFLRHPFPPDVPKRHLGFFHRKLGGEFLLASGGLCTGNKPVKPEGTNGVWTKKGQTAAIRVHMEKREARLFIDDEEQPGIFTDIPIQVVLGISLDKVATPFSFEVVHLKRLSPAAPHPFLRPSLTNSTDYWPGTNSLETLDTSVHKITATQLVQVAQLETSTTYRTAFTFPITYGEWELKVRANHTYLSNTYLGYLRYPLPPNATQMLCEDHHGAIGGDFGLMYGGQKRDGLVIPKLTNRQCNDVGQTAAIRIDMEKREARLFVDDIEQPHALFPLPNVLCLAISTGFDPAGLSLEVMWLKRLQLTRSRSLPRNTPTCIHGTACLQTLPPSFIPTSNSILSVMTRGTQTKGHQTAFTYPISQGEWEFRIKPLRSEFGAYALGFLRYPLPTNSTEKSLSEWEDGISGAFVLKTGQTIVAGRDTCPTIRNDVWIKPNQTAAIRVNMDRREAVLFYDKLEQNGIITDIPSPLCLGVTVDASEQMKMIEIVHFTQLPPSEPVQRDRSAVLYLTGEATLAPSLTNQIITQPISEGVWEWRIQIPEEHRETAIFSVMDGPTSLSVGDFHLGTGAMFRRGKVFKPVGTNEKCRKPKISPTLELIGGEAAIRVDMKKREARLFIDDEEQPGIFPNIPSEVRLLLKLKTPYENISKKIVHLKRVDLVIDRAPQPRLENTSDNWPGTNSLKTLDTTAHELKPRELIQVVRRDEDPKWRTAYTFPIEEGEWELAIFTTQKLYHDARLCFASAPLQPGACTASFRTSNDGDCGYFDLPNGSMYRQGQFFPLNLNSKCITIRRKAAIRVDMARREARLFLEDIEQPGVFTDIPSPLCLGISTAYPIEEEIALHVLGLKKLPPSPSPLSSNTPTCLNGTSCLSNYDRLAIYVDPTTLRVSRRSSSEPEFRADTGSLFEGEWELKIRGGRDMFLNTKLAYFAHPNLKIKSPTVGEKPKFSGSFSLKDCIDAVKNERDRTAAIRVNMEKREAKLFVDDVEHSRTFENIPPILNLSIITAFTDLSYKLEVLHLKRLDDNPENSPPSLPNTPNCWPGTNSIETFDRAGLVISPTQIVPRVILELNPICYTAYTFPIEEGEWELKIRTHHKRPPPVDLGFVRYPLPSDATTKSCRPFGKGIGGAFSVLYGYGWSGEQLHRVGTNKMWEVRKEKSVERVYQTAAIRVNMSTRVAKLFVNDEEQRGVINAIPDKLCLAITPGVARELSIIEVLHLKRLDAPAETPQSAPSPDTQAVHSTPVSQETQDSAATPVESSGQPTPSSATPIESSATPIESSATQTPSSATPVESSSQPTPSAAASDLSAIPSTQPQPTSAPVSTLPASRSPSPSPPTPQNTDDQQVGTSCLQTIDATSHHTTQFVLTARVSAPKVVGFRTAFTAPLTKGEWELKIRGTASLFPNILLGFLKHPLRPNATQKSCGSWADGSGGGFVLKTGQMWKGGQFKPAGTNKACVRVGQTAAIRVNMSTREAKLFVDDEEQPGVFTDIPSPLCLALTTAVKGTTPFTVEVLWLKRI
ncbi:putative Cyclin-dependent kinase 2 [Blattamonas nauphoetae]|uniref:non-specific serine/threonine protein kinase n=1 Tax=Blattamonas nauphoetae TaxID=2049346 RepID=A0ABQ9XAA9_9EUKA|nr:putative Cyclin-dependent kinase 2 [Blattamonas nauphoetae]